MANGDLAQRDGLSGLLALLGNTKGTSSTTTSKSNISKAGADALIKQILESTQGLAAVSSGQHASGMYNSTVNTQLTNDLLSRTAGEVEKLRAGTTTTTRTPPKIGASDLMSMFALSAGKSLFGPSIKRLAGDTGVDGYGEQLANAIFGGGDGGTGYEGGAFLSGGEDMASQAIDAFSSTGSSAVADFGSGLLSDSVASDTASSVGTEVASDVASEAATDTAAESISEEGASEIAGQSWVICTQLNSIGELSDELYDAGVKRIPYMHPMVVKGYHLWAIPYTRMMRKSKLATRIVRPVAIGRARYLSGKPSMIGWATVKLGEPICHFLGHMTTKVEDWRTLYASS